MKYRIADIVVKDRRRKASDITALAASIQEIGLLNPVTIQPDGTLVAGLNRIEACKSLGWEEIEVNIAQLDQLHAALAEIDENLVRTELHYLDRDDWVKRRKEIYEELHPETKQGAKGGWHNNKTEKLENEINSLSRSFSEDTADKIGESKRNIELSIQRAKAFTPEQKEVLKQADISQTKATELARLEEPKRELVIQSLASGKSFEDVQREVKRDTHVMNVMGSSDSPEWYTPPEIVTAVLELMKTIELDPCSNSHEDPKVPATTRYTKGDNGLSQPWKGKTYLNPPYGSEIGIWTNRLVEAYKSGDVEEAIALLPGRIDTNWFNPLYEYLICIIKGRVQFENSPHHAPFPCVLVYLGSRRDEFTRVFSSFGPIVERIA